MKASFLFISVLIITSALTPLSTFSGESYSGTSLQQQSPAENMAKRETAWMNHELSLSPDQLKKVDSINLVYAQKTIQNRHSNNADMATMRIQKQQIRDQKHEALSNVLTSDQMAKYDAVMKNRKQKVANPQTN